jgi:hypothetical protein
MGAAFMPSTDAITAAKNAQLKQQTPAFAGSTTALGGPHEGGCRLLSATPQSAGASVAAGHGGGVAQLVRAAES